MGKAVSVKLEDEERERLASLAEMKQRSPHFLMREAIKEYLAREEKHLAFYQEAEAAWIDYKETGRHLTLEDMETWAKHAAAPLPRWRK
ncbi:MAG: ribbon-helix-helix protein, CopG family [Rhizobiales bacterium]|nr:ribbon-helix-helix protein, CopG family [Hyphomicrobiales bacterium]